MALERVSIPSPNHSGPRPSNRILCIHTSEGARDGRSLGNFLSQSSSQVSYQTGFDNTSASRIYEYVPWNLTAWAAMQANSWGQHGCLCTPTGASSGWSRQYWLDTQDTMIRAAAAWCAEEANRCGIPIQKIGPDEIQRGGSGICGHHDCSLAGAGGGHTDPGDFPFDVLIAYALGGADFPPIPTGPVAVYPRRTPIH